MGVVGGVVGMESADVGLMLTSLAMIHMAVEVTGSFKVEQKTNCRI